MPQESLKHGILENAREEILLLLHPISDMHIAGVIDYFHNDFRLFVASGHFQSLVNWPSNSAALKNVLFLNTA